MISTPEFETQSSMLQPFAGPQHCEECVRQLTAAEREMGAFVMAVGNLYGKEAASYAADHWVSVAEGSTKLTPGNGFPSWRHITISVASHLATKYGGCKQDGNL